MPRINRSGLRRVTRAAHSSDSEDDEMSRFKVHAEDDWVVGNSATNSPVDLYGVSDDDDEDDDDTGGVEGNGGMGLGPARNRGADGLMGDKEPEGGSDQGSSGPRASPQRGVLPSIEQTWQPLASYDVPRPARRGIPRRSHTASSLSAGSSSSSPSRSPSPPPKRARTESEERGGYEEDAYPYPAAPLLADPASGVGPWSEPPGFEDPPLTAADSAQHPAANSASIPSSAANAVVDPSPGGSPSAPSPPGSPFAPSLVGSPFAPNLSGPPSGSSSTAHIAAAPSLGHDTAVSSSVPAGSYSRPSSPTVALDSVLPSVAGSSSLRRKSTRFVSASANSVAANPVSTEADPRLRRSSRRRKPVSTPAEKDAATPVSKGRIEILEHQLRDNDGKKYNAFKFRYREAGDDGEGTWETEDELWKTYEEEVLTYWKGGRTRALEKLIGKENMSDLWLAKIYYHEPLNSNPRLRALPDTNVRKHRYRWGWIGYRKRKWDTWDGLGRQHGEVREHYITKYRPELVDSGPITEDDTPGNN